ncbi:MAG TPA: TetR/AcrR family transcriptional regulator [Ktedonobacteraceae bacterium]
MSPRTEESNKRIREEQKERILNAAMTVFAHNGYSETKMSEIAAAAQVSYGLAYHYFANKEAIFTALLQRTLKGALDLMQYARVQPGTPWERLRWLTAEMLRGARDEPEYEMVVLQALTSSAVPEETRKMVLGESRSVHEALKLLIIDGQVSGEVVAEDPELLATAWEWCIQGMVFDMSYQGYASARLPGVEVVLRLLKA